jgi:hypothetical protein
MVEVDPLGYHHERNAMSDTSSTTPTPSEEDGRVAENPSQDTSVGENPAASHDQSADIPVVGKPSQAEGDDGDA